MGGVGRGANQVNPQNYEECILYLEGRRKHDEFIRTSKLAEAEAEKDQRV